MARRGIARNPRRFYVYVFFRPNGIPVYVGKGQGDRWKAHAKYATNPHLATIFRKAGGRLPLVIVRENLTEAEALETENALVVALGRGPHGYLVNMTDGGAGVPALDPQARARMSDAALRRTTTPEAKAAFAARAIGRVRWDLDPTIVLEVGCTFGSLTVIGPYRTDPGRAGARQWLCRCVCGSETWVRGANLRAGTTQSCGCFHDALASKKMTLWTGAQSAYWQIHPKIWITNGTDTKRLLVGEDMPEGWRRGRVFPYRGGVRG